MIIDIDCNDLADYTMFLKARGLPRYEIKGRRVIVPDDLRHLIDGSQAEQSNEYAAPNWMFDYQAAIVSRAIAQKKFAVFADCGLGKTAILLEFARHAWSAGKRTLIVSPLMVINQTIDEADQFFGDSLPMKRVKSSDLQSWLDAEGYQSVGITNYEAMRDIDPTSRVDCLILDESSILKSHYGKYGRELIRLGRQAEYKLALTGTPAPNDRIEFANHAVFLDVHRTVNEFLARYFINRGQTSNRWELKPHAIRPFYRDLSSWSIFVSNPSVYGWTDNCETLPPIHIHIEHVDMTAEQQAAVQELTGGLFAANSGGIGQRSKLGQIAKGSYRGDAIPTLKPAYIRKLVDQWPNESTLIWCLYNDEQQQLEQWIPEAGSITGSTSETQRQKTVDAFKAGTIKTLISKPSILGFGLNLQIATRQIFSGLQDSYEQFYQAVKRSNRYGSTNPLNVHIPVCDVEIPMVQNVLLKSDRVDADTREQEKIFSESQLSTAPAG